MSKTKNTLIFLLVLILVNFTEAQIEPLYDYNIIDIDDYNGYSEYRLQGKKYYQYRDKVVKNEKITVYSYDIVKENDTIYNLKTEDITFFSILKKRYLFHSIPKNKKDRQ